MDNLTSLKKHYPNALARIRVSLRDMRIEHVASNRASIVERESQMDSLDNAKPKKTSNSFRKGKQSDSAEIEQIWKSLGLGKIDISYACIGYTLDGRPVLNQDEFINLLVNYGFTIASILDFIDDFAQQALHDSMSPIVMYSSNTARIMTEIEPIANKRKK